MEHGGDPQSLFNESSVYRQVWLIKGERTTSRGSIGAVLTVAGVAILARAYDTTAAAEVGGNFSLTDEAGG